jgi:hypothetical protein
MKVPVVVRPDYTMYLESWEGLSWFHTDVHSWTPNVYREYVYHLDLLQWLLDDHLYAVVDNDPKLAKFGSKIGFEFLETKPAKDGRDVDIYFRSK